MTSTPLWRHLCSSMVLHLKTKSYCHLVIGFHKVEGPTVLWSNEIKISVRVMEKCILHWKAVSSALCTCGGAQSRHGLFSEWQRSIFYFQETALTWAVWTLVGGWGELYSSNCSILRKLIIIPYLVSFYLNYESIQPCCFKFSEEMAVKCTWENFLTWVLSSNAVREAKIFCRKSSRSLRMLSYCFFCCMTLAFFIISICWSSFFRTLKSSIFNTAISLWGGYLQNSGIFLNREYLSIWFNSKININLAYRWRVLKTVLNCAVGSSFSFYTCQFLVKICALTNAWMFHGPVGCAMSSNVACTDMLQNARLA